MWVLTLRVASCGSPTLPQSMICASIALDVLLTLHNIWPIIWSMWLLRWYPLPSPSVILYSRLISDYLSLNREDHVLDAGCGTGHLTYMLSPMVARSVGVDISRPTLELVNAKLGAKELIKRRLQYQGGDICNPAFGEEHAEAFTKAFSIHALEHVSDPHRFVRSLAQCLRPGGSVMAVFPNSTKHGRRFFAQVADIRDIFTNCGLSLSIYAMSQTRVGKASTRVYYRLRDCYRMLRKESLFSAGNEFHETRYYVTLETTRFSRLALSIIVAILQPVTSRLALYKLEPLDNTDQIGETEVCVLAKKEQVGL